MTQNQIAYWQMKHDYDIESQKVSETQRSNLAKEAETKRSNLQKEHLQRMADMAKYGRLKYNYHALEDIGQSVELLQTMTDVFDWVLSLFTGAGKAFGRR